MFTLWSLPCTGLSTLQSLAVGAEPMMRHCKFWNHRPAYSTKRHPCSTSLSCSCTRHSMPWFFLRPCIFTSKSEFVGEYPTTKKYLQCGLNRLNHLRPTDKLANSAFNIVRELYQKVLAAISPADLYCHLGNSECSNLTGVEAGISQAFWSDSVQASLGNALPPRPLNVLLSDGSSYMHLVGATPLDELT